ncbi:hypothetical protein [Streptomyces violascens]|nr:hypothetical protein [Streptomyces violascens]
MPYATASRAGQEAEACLPEPRARTTARAPVLLGIPWGMAVARRVSA